MSEIDKENALGDVREPPPELLRLAKKLGATSAGAAPSGDDALERLDVIPPELRKAIAARATDAGGPAEDLLGASERPNDELKRPPPPPKQ